MYVYMYVCMYVCMSVGTEICTDIVTREWVSARAAATEVDTIWQLAENSTWCCNLSKGTASILMGSTCIW